MTNSPAPPVTTRLWPLRLLLVLIIVGAGLVALLLSAPTMILRLMTPSAPFDEAAVPPAPDYANDQAWLALPGTVDEADVALPELPAAIAPQVDVFYLHPTSSIAATWNAPWHDAQVRAASIRGGTLIQASAFNGSGAVYAPAYRQASGTAFTTSSPSAARAIDLAYHDVDAAFTEFLRRSGGARPFLLVGHSQGAALAARLLRERIAAGPERARLVAAYPLGALLSSSDLGGVPACGARDQAGCVVTFNARGPDFVEDAAFELDASASAEPHLCVNPVLGAAAEEPVARNRHGGALFFDAEQPALLPAFAAAQCRRGRLVVTELQPLPPRDLPSAMLLWVMGGDNFHPIEVQLFYADLRADAARRVAAYLATSPH